MLIDLDAIALAPHDAFDAANILLNALQEDTVVTHVSIVNDTRMERLLPR